MAGVNANPRFSELSSHPWSRSGQPFDKNERANIPAEYGARSGKTGTPHAWGHLDQAQQFEICAMCWSAMLVIDLYAFRLLARWTYECTFVCIKDVQGANGMVRALGSMQRRGRGSMLPNEPGSLTCNSRFGSI